MIHLSAEDVRPGASGTWAFDGPCLAPYNAYQPTQAEVLLTFAVLPEASDHLV